MKLEAFLALPFANEVKKEIFVNDRLGKLTITPISTARHKDYMKKATTYKNGRPEFDSTVYNIECVAWHVEGLTDADFLKATNCGVPQDFVVTRLLAGEVTEIAGQIARLSGFDSTLSEDIEEAKN